MSFKINKSELDITNEIQCNYYRCNVYLNQYRKKQKNGGGGSLHVRNNAFEYRQ